MKAVVNQEGWLYKNKSRSEGDIVEVTGDQFSFFNRLGILSKYQKKEAKKNVDNKHSKPSNTN